MLLTNLFRGIGGGMGAGAPKIDKAGIKRTKAVEVVYDEYLERGYDYLSYYNEDHTDTVWYKFKPKADGDFRFYVENIDVEYYFTLYDGKKEICRFGTNEDLVYNLEKGNKYYVTLTQSSGSYDLNYTLRVGAAIPMGADRDHAYYLQLGSNAAQDYESLLPPPDLSGDKKSNRGDTAVGSMDKESGSGEVWFKYTAQSNGQHTFTLTDFTSNSNFDIYEGANTYTSTSLYGSPEIKCYLNQGTTYYIRVGIWSDYSDMDTNFGVMIEDEPAGMSKNNAIEIQLGANTEQAWEALEGEGSEVWFKLQPGTTGYYSFAFENSKEAFTPEFNVYRAEWTVNEYSTYSISENNGYYNFSDEKGIYLIRVRTYSYDSFAVNVDMLKGTSVDNAVEIDAENPIAAPYFYNVHYSGGSGNGLYFKFTPDAAGFYTFSTSGFSNTNYLTLYLYEESDTSNSGYITYTSGSSITAELDADTTYYLRTYYTYYASSPFDVTVNVDEVLGGTDRNTAVEIQLGENEAQEWEVLDNQYYMYFKFQPEVSGVYSFTLSDESGYNPYYIYTSATGSSTLSAYTVNGQYVWYMSSGTTYYLYYSLSTGYGEFGINVEQVDMGVTASDAIELELGKAISTGYNSSFNSNYSIWYKFTPTTSGDYVFSLTNANTRYLYLYSDPTSSYDSSSGYISDAGNSWKQYLSANTTYYLKVNFSSSYDTGFEIGVREYKTGYNSSSANKLAVGTGMNYGYNSSYNSNGEVWFEFTPDETAYYRFTTTNASRRYLYVYDSTVSNYVYQLSSYTSDSSYTTPYLRLEADSTYYFCVDFSSSTYYDASFEVSVSKYNISKLTLGGEIYTGYSTNYYNQEMWYKFDTTDSGYYRVYVYDLVGSSSYRAYVEIYDANGNQIASKNTANSSISVSSDGLDANSTYYVRVYFPNYTDGSFTVGLYQY